MRIADALRGEIASGDLTPGDRLPPETALLERFGVSLPTLRQAVGVLRAEGLIESKNAADRHICEERESPRTKVARTLWTREERGRRSC